MTRKQQQPPSEGLGLGLVFVIETEKRLWLQSVKLESKRIWLTQQQIAEMFKTSCDHVGRKLKYLFDKREFPIGVAPREFTVVQTEGERQFQRRILHYNLDVIIPLGYRIDSFNGSWFRNWANRTLKRTLLKECESYRNELKRQRQPRTRRKAASKRETDKAVQDIITKYAASWRLRLEYDENRLPVPFGGEPSYDPTFSPEQVLIMVARFRQELDAKGEASPLFGHPRENALEAIISSLEQTVDGEPLYPNPEIKAAHLLYFMVKDHPFTDSNKRIGSPLFLVYLELARIVHQINPPALTALTLLIAGSASSQKDQMIGLIASLLSSSE